LRTFFPLSLIEVLVATILGAIISIVAFLL
jgi:hypothetical protein